MKNLKRQDRNGTRTSEELRRRYKFKNIELTAEEVEYLKKLIVVDSSLSTTSTNPVQNKVITDALNTKVSKEFGKGLSTNDFTNYYKEQIELNTTDRHKHSNQTVLNTFTKTEEELLGEITDNAHSHTNKTVLDEITSDKVKRWDNIPLYENGGTTDANTTTEELILTKVNTPTTDFWYVETLFYGSKATSSNRKQIAYSYKFDAPIYTRYYISGTWSEWTTGEIKSSNITDYEGHLWFKNGMLLQWGQIIIKPAAANTVTSTEITFPLAYEFAPFITASPQISTPNACTCSIGVGSTDGGAKSGMKIYMTRTNTSETNFRWIAIGYKTA